MRTSRSTATFLIQCKDKRNCKTAINSLEKKYRRNIRAIHKTIPFSNPEKIRDRLTYPDMVQLGKADYIVEIVTGRHSELENIKKDFESKFQPNMGLLTVT